ncbi:MAG TPA: CtsR family transcriptional regulator [Clostridiales bacterium]|jgi:transcriptional regulator CtsR|nr:CtsR family transcriptional regulator [Clostridiales bacterium]
MGISDVIAGFISEIMEEAGGIVEMQRAELAQRFNCVPSQINYVISTRFSPEHGYIVESRRGGSGYIRITRIQTTGKQLLMHTVNAVGDEIDFNTAKALLSNASHGGVLSKEAAKLISSAISDNALRPVQPEARNTVRASIMKHMLINSV